MGHSDNGHEMSTKRLLVLVPRIEAVYKFERGISIFLHGPF